MILKRIKPEDYDYLRLKVLARDLFKGKKPYKYSFA
jgi:hypothetical protein